MNTLKALLFPKSVAIIGASRSPKKVGAIALKNIIASGFKGKIYPVNPKEKEIAKLTCYSDITSLPQKPDLAVIAVPAPIVIPVLEQLGQANIKNAVIFSAGFKEIGEAGLEREQQLISLAKKYQLNILGPNCLGFANNSCPINVTFAQVVKQPGNLRFLSQSGAIASSIFDWFEASHLGFDQFITLGNKSVLTENDFLQYWLDHDKENSNKDLAAAQPVAMYLESISHGRTFTKLATKLSQKQPLIILKPGKSQAAAKAMQSHTGAIAGSDAVLDQVLRQAGVIRCDGPEELFDLSRSFSWQNAPLGPNVAVVSNAGGPGVISADVISEVGLQLAEFDPTTKAELVAKLPREASILNPVDVLGDALGQRYEDAIEIVLGKDCVHALLIILTPQVMTQISQTAEMIGKVAAKFDKPVVCSFMGGKNISKGEKVLNSYHIPSFRFPERAIKALAKMWWWQQWRQTQGQFSKTTTTKMIDQNKVKQVIDKATSQNRPTLDSFETNQLFKAAKITIPPTALAKTPSQAQHFARIHGFPVVLKMISHKLLHKTEMKGVVTKIKNRDHLESVYSQMAEQIHQLEPDIKDTVKIQVQKQILDGVEIIAGIKRDPNFGPIVMFGAGGTLAELIADRNLHTLPLNSDQARFLIEHSKIYKILNGYRGQSPYAIDKLVDLLVKLAALAQHTPQLSEIEINPVIVTHDNVWAVDGKTILAENKS
ncbi:hypothetical protein GYA49_02835 [Candidatus Beckwithbacteria bacterium]|nr:hypothetical protein [Candidatus Beckwithbacteria bacterium]